MNNNKAAVIIDGPEDVLNSKDVNNPIITDNKPPIIEGPEGVLNSKEENKPNITDNTPPITE